MKNVILIVILLAFGCSNQEKECLPLKIARFSLISDETDYYEIYWDKSGNHFIFDGVLGESFIKSIEEDSLISKYIKQIQEKPCKIEQISRQFYSNYLGVKITSLNQIIEGNNNVLSSKKTNFSDFKKNAYSRYIEWQKEHEKFKASDTITSITDTLL
jgi:hypothetical protein